MLKGLYKLSYSPMVALPLHDDYKRIMCLVQFMVRQQSYEA